MRRRKLLVALAGVALVVAAGVVVVRPRADRITQANYDRIQIGMSRADVEAILGAPGDYRTGPGEVGMVYDSAENMVWESDFYMDHHGTTLPNWSKGLSQSAEDQLLWTSWMSDSVLIGIAIDDSGSVVDKLGYPRRTTQGPLDSLLWRLKRQWHRWFP